MVSIRELGILREIRRAANAPELLEVVITPTYSGCPALGQISQDIGLALAAAGLRRRVIVTVLSPAWTTDWIHARRTRKIARLWHRPAARCGFPQARKPSIG